MRREFRRRSWASSPRRPRAPRRRRVRVRDEESCGVRSPVDAKMPAESRLLDELQHACEVDEVLAHALAQRLHLGLGELKELVDRSESDVRLEPSLATGGARTVG